MGRSVTGARRTGTVTAFMVVVAILGIPPVGAARGHIIAQPSHRPRGLQHAASVVPGEIVVSYRARASRRGMVGVRAAAGVELVRGVDSVLEVVRVPPGKSFRRAIARLSADPIVAHAEPNRVFTASEVIPDDLNFGDQWGLDNVEQFPLSTEDADIDAPEAWGRATGAPAVTVAIVDTGVALDHPDLAANIWVNPGETGEGKESNGEDDDGNGYIDDWEGWDFVGADNDPYDEHGHGTHVAGIAGARGNNGTGISGVAWDVKLMPVRVLDQNGSGSLDDVALAFRYAGRMGAEVVSASLGAVGGGEPAALRDAVEVYPGTLFVVAAGNDTENNDLVPTWPCNSTAVNLVCVAASDEDDELAWFSNWGAHSVDIAAPGNNILSTFYDPLTELTDYEYMSGTSMATPFVAGAAAMVWQERPAEVSRARWRRHVVDVLHGGAQRAESWMRDDLRFQGRLNLDRTLRYTGDLTEPTDARVFGFTGRFRTEARYPVRFSASDSGGALLRSYDARIRRAAPTATGFTSWRYWKKDLREARAGFAGRGGTTYCYSSRARDNAFNVSAWSAQRCTAVPVNDRALLVTDGWTRRTHSAAFRDTFSRARARGSALQMPRARFRTLALIATTCPTCGKVAIFRGAERIRTLSLRSARLRRARVLPIMHSRRIRGPAPIAIVVVSRGKPVMIEGLGISRL